MEDLLLATGLLAGLGCSFGVGRFVQALLPDQHRTPDTTDFVRNSAGLIVTLTAVVLGLLLTSVNASFEKTSNDLRKYAATIVLLDRDLDAMGPPMVAARSLLRRYVASVLVSNWPDETPPEGPYAVERGHGTEIDSPQLADLLQKIEDGLRAFKPSEAGVERLQSAALAQIEAMFEQRWTLIGEAHSSITPQFLGIVTVWLALLFLAFGLIAPRNPVGVAASGFLALSVAGAVFLALELDGPLDGLIIVSSEPMRHALFHIDHMDHAGHGTPAAEGSAGFGAW